MLHPTRLARRGVSTVFLTIAAVFAILASETVQAQAASEPAWRAAVHDLARDHFQHPAWGFSHAERDYELSRKLGAADHAGLDDDVLYAAAYLHDIAGFTPWSKAGVDHADQGAEVVGPILTQAGFPISKLPAVQAAIRTHMYQRDPVGPEARYLHDADTLDWLGVIGAVRIIALVDPKGGAPKAPDAIALLRKYLAETPSRLVTPSGKALGQVRAEELRRFIAALEGETDGLNAL